MVLPEDGEEVDFGGRDGCRLLRQRLRALACPDAAPCLALAADVQTVLGRNGELVVCCQTLADELVQDALGALAGRDLELKGILYELA